MANATNVATYEVVILGSGYAGLMAALGLSGRNPLKRIALISERDDFVERIRLQEGVSGPVADRMPPLPRFLANSKITFVRGWVEALDPARRCVRVAVDGEAWEIAFDRCVYALGSSTEVTVAAGVGEHAYRLDPGDGSRSARALRSRIEACAGQALRVVVVGGANTATEVAGEIKSTWPQVEVTMISRSRAGDFQKGKHLESIARSELQSLGIRLIDGQTVTEVKADGVVTASGEVFSADICVWAAGVRSAPIARAAGLAVDHQDRIWADPRLSSTSHPNILAVGDAVHPLASTGARYRMSAFGAIITGAYAARRIVEEARGRSPRPFSFSAYGQGVAIGHRGVGFFTFPNDTGAYLVMRGPLALRIRNLFVWSLVFFLKLERRLPGSSLFWIGRRRVSWERARQAVRNLPQTAAAARAVVNGD